MFSIKFQVKSILVSSNIFQNKLRRFFQLSFFQNIYINKLIKHKL